MTQRVAIVVQRAGQGIVGGSESYAMNMAKAMSQSVDVTILTTTAKSHETWQPDYSEGVEILSDNLRIHRFNAQPRHRDLYRLNAMLTPGVSSEQFANIAAEEQSRLMTHIRRSPLGFSEIWIRYTGPVSDSLLDHLRTQPYDAVFFMTYLYATTYFGIKALPQGSKAFIVPTYHHEPAVYLPSFQAYRDTSHLFLTEAEKRLAESLLYHQPVPSQVIGFGMADKGTSAQKDKTVEPYLLYAGRLESYKGVQWLYDCFTTFYAKHPNVKLYIIGDGPLKNVSHPGIVYKGFVDEAEKLRLMQNALAFVHPSAYESLGIVLLEAFMMSTPGLVNAQCAVLSDHIQASNAGMIFADTTQFEMAVLSLLQHPEQQTQFGWNGRHYYLSHYTMDAYTQKLLSLLN